MVLVLIVSKLYSLRKNMILIVWYQDERYSRFLRIFRLAVHSHHDVPKIGSSVVDIIAHFLLG